MSQKFRYSIDLGSGYALLSNVYDNNLKLRFSKDDSLRIKSGSISGSIKIAGTEAVNAWAYRTTTYYVLFLVEEWNGATWNDLFECNIDLRGEYLEQSKVLILGNFIEAESQLTNVLSNIKKPFRTDDLGIAQTAITQTITPTKFDVVSAPTLLAAAAYQAAFNVENYPIPGDTRWAFFVLTLTTPLGGGVFVYTWSTRQFLYRPGTQANLNGYSETLWGLAGAFGGATRVWWQLPPAVPWTGPPFAAQLTTETYRLDNVLNAVISAFDATLSFDNADAGDLTFSTVSYFGDGNDFNNTDIIGIEFTFEKIIKWLDYYYDLSWYLDSNKLKFQAAAWEFKNVTLDWSSELTNLDRLEFAYNPMPDREKWSTSDVNVDRFLISYFDKDVKTDDVEIDYTIDLMQDFWEILKGDLSKDKLVWVRLSGGNVVVRTMKDYFDNAYILASFSEYERFIVPTNPATAYSKVGAGASDTRPVVLRKHKKWISDYSAFDLFSFIIGGGYLYSYEIDLDTGIGEFFMRT